MDCNICFSMKRTTHKQLDVLAGRMVPITVTNPSVLDGTASLGWMQCQSSERLPSLSRGGGASIRIALAVDLSTVNAFLELSGSDKAGLAFV